MEQEVLKFLLNNCRVDFVIVLVGLWFIYKKVKRIEDNFLNIECGVRAGLLSHLTAIHSNATKLGHIKKDTLRIAEECFKQYKGLGGDGYADGIMNELRTLQIK